MSLAQVYSAASNSVGSSSSGSSRGTGTCKTRYRTVHLKRDPRLHGSTFGFSFRGGREFGTGFFVSVVEHGSEAHLKGLKVGDQIVRINGLSVDNATHQEILQLAQHHHHLTLSLKSVGLIPVKDNCDDPLTWKVVEDPLDPALLSSACDVDRILIDAPQGSKLGCGICKGPDWRPGIFIQYTKPGSLSRQAGLQPGDQILQCNRVSFINIDFAYAVSVLKSQGTLDLIVRKGSGIDLFPGESSGYSSASSTADEPLTHQSAIAKRMCPPPPPPRSEMDRSPSLKSSASVGCLLDELKNSGRNRSLDLIDCPPPPLLTFRQECKYGSQTVVQISGGSSSRSMEVQVHQEDNASLDKTSTTSSFSSLSSAISQELQRRKEKQKLASQNGELADPNFPVRKSIEGKNKEHDSLIAELKRRQDRRNGCLQNGSATEAVTECQPPGSPCNPPPLPPPPPDSPPPCPTPDYSDSSAQQSPQPNHTVKTSILRFEERNKKLFTPKSVTFGASSTKEITPIKNEPPRVPLTPKENHLNNPEVEMQSIDDHELLQPKPVAPKPPSTYFRPPPRKDLSDSPKRTTVIKIMEYPSENSRTPGKLDFLPKNGSADDSFEGELAKTLSRSNLKGRSESIAIITNGVLKTESENRNSVVKGTPAAYIPYQQINQDEVSTVKKSLRTFERNTGTNTIIVQIPKRN